MLCAIRYSSSGVESHRVCMCVCVCVCVSAYSVCVLGCEVSSLAESHADFLPICFFVIVAAFFFPSLLTGVLLLLWACADSNAEFCLHLAKDTRQLGSEWRLVRRAFYPVPDQDRPSVSQTVRSSPSIKRCFGKCERARQGGKYCRRTVRGTRTQSSFAQADNYSRKQVHSEANQQTN